MRTTRQRFYLLILVLFTALSLLLSACSNGSTPTGDNSTPGTSPGAASASEGKSKTVSTKPEDRQGGEFGGNAGTSYTQSKSVLTYNGCSYFISENGYKLYKMSADGAMTELDISSMESVYEGYGPLLGLLFVCDGRLYDVSGNWISVDGNESGKWDNADDSFTYSWELNLGFFAGDRFYYIESDIEYRRGIEPFSVVTDDYTEEEIDRIFEEYYENQYSGIVSVPLNEILETPPFVEEWYIAYTPSTVIKSFENERGYDHRILFMDSEWIYYSAQKSPEIDSEGFVASHDSMAKIYRVSLDGEKENFIFEIDINNCKNLNFIGDYVYYIENADGFTNLCRIKADGTGSAEIILASVAMYSLNSYGDSLYLELDGIYAQSNGHPFMSTGTMYIARLKIEDAVPGTSPTDLFEKTQRFDIQKTLTPGMWNTGGIGIFSDWIFYTSNIDGKIKMLKTDFSQELDMPGQDSAQSTNIEGR